MIDRTVVVFFRDKLNADDYVATCFININEVSASGEHGIKIIQELDL